MIKKLSQCIGEYKKNAILSPVFVALEVCLEVLIPFFIAFVVDRGINKANMQAVVFYGVIIVLLAGLAMFFGVQSGRHAAAASAGFSKNLRHKLYYNIQNFSFSNIDRFSTSSLVTRLTTDVTNMQNSFQMIIRIAVRSPLMLVFSLIMAFSVNATVSLVFLGTIPLLALGLYIIIKNAHPIFRRVFVKYDRLNRVVQENLRGIRVVKSYVRESHEVDKFKDASMDIFQLYSKAEKMVAFTNPLMQFCMYLTTLLFAWIGAHLIVGGEMETGQLMSLLTYSMQILISLMMLSMVFVMITISRASAERIVEVMDESSDITTPEKAVQEVKDGSITFENVQFSYIGSQEKLCLLDVNLEIKSGETVGIIGGTGSSKSTLVQLIPRLYDVTGGSVKVGGVDVRKYDIESLRSQVAMVLQKNELFSGTIKENLRWGNRNATDEELVHVCKLAQADSFINQFPDGYDTFIEQGGTNVSGGQKQRLCIARALLKKPKILILDDSTSAVDTKTDRLINDAFQQEIPDTTKIIIAQRISSVEHADKIIVMDAGKVNAVGTHETLLKSNEIYREVYQSQVKGDQ